MEENKFENRLLELEKVPEIEPKYKPKQKFNWRDLIIGLVLVLIIIGASFFASSSNPELNQQYYVQGARDFYKDLLTELVKCEPLPLQLNDNETVNAILVECLQQG